MKSRIVLMIRNKSAGTYGYSYYTYYQNSEMMQNIFNRINVKAFIVVLTTLTFFMLPDILEARRGGRSFGGSRRSFGRKSSSNKSRGSSFGKKSTRSKSNSKRSSFGSKKSSRPTDRMRSAGGKQLNSKKDYTKSYGTPRKTTTQSVPVKTANGTSNQNYRVHSYGGYGSGLMTGYMLGAMPWYWSTPFHGAFYYGAPQYYTAKDGSVDVYPGRFSWSKLFVGIIVIAGIIFLVYRIFIRRKRSSDYTSSSGSFG